MDPNGCAGLDGSGRLNSESRPTSCTPTLHFMSAADVHAPVNSLLFFAPKDLASSRPTSPAQYRPLSSPTSDKFDIADDDDEQPVRRSFESAQRPVNLSYGVSAIGRGVTSDWRWNNTSSEESSAEETSAPSTSSSRSESESPSWSLGFSVIGQRPRSASPPPVEPEPAPVVPVAILSDEPDHLVNDYDQPSNPESLSASRASSQPSSRPSSPRPRRRDSKQRVSLVAGRLSILSIQPPPSPPHSLSRYNSSVSVVSTAPPTPSASVSNSLSDRSIDQFVIEGEAGRGAYGVVKRARERLPDGSLGEQVILKQVVKSRILADCWKKHPRLGTIPIEIYVMSAISNTPYTLPNPRRPWDPQRSFVTGVEPPSRTDGESAMGHPNICKLIDFWEDAHFYYLVLPNAHPHRQPGKPGDLFDLVELYPSGLPPHLIRSYLGQMADATAFLHAKGIGEVICSNGSAGQRCSMFAPLLRLQSTATSKTKTSSLQSRMARAC